MTEPALLHLHEDAAFFREALNFTATQTRFAPPFIEKDYFCSVILQYLTMTAPELVFRGGTCLAKVHLGLYRLSEDLDFLISTPVDATHTQRSQLAASVKRGVAALEKRLRGFRLVTPLSGANDSRQYAAIIGYPSLLTGREAIVKVEVGLREPTLMSTIAGEAKTMLLDPISGLSVAPALPVPCLSREEAMAEKLRAALSRREAAIRDFYDVHYAVHRRGFHVHGRALLELVRRKLAIPGNGPVDVSANRLAVLRPQLESQLRPVLRDPDFVEFDLSRAFGIVAEIAAALTDGR